MNNELDELCLRSRPALQVYFMRLGFSEEDAELLANRCFYNGEWGGRAQYHQITTISRIRKELEKVISDLEKEHTQYVEAVLLSSRKLDHFGKLLQLFPLLEQETA